MAVEGHTKLYLEMGKNVKLVWLKVEKLREMRKERLFVSFRRTLYESIRKEKSGKPRIPRTRYGCSVCQIPLCQGGTCWQEHSQLSKRVD